ncbi:HNH endonuclease [Cellulosimicrobium sp. 22601]|uniref:HNH endonuclease n=1 Tax=unclassified Cellulosimicrobium TaxID=2624466 RepID=UPI003F87F2A6
MGLRSFSDVPNRIVRLYLQEAGRQYDANRGLPRFGSMTRALIARFESCCAYCGEPGLRLVEEHLVPINRDAVGLHAWGNIVPACRPRNDIKAGKPWSTHPKLDAARRTAIATYVAEYAYAPNVTELRAVVEKLYALADSQTRSLVDFGLVASRPFITGLHVEDGYVSDT